MGNLIGYCLVLVNIISFAQMGIDKRRARRGQYRISERKLLSLAVFGGSIGSLLGMYIFRHKTKHLRFVVGVPLILVLQVALLIYLVQQGIFPIAYEFGP